MAATIMSLSRQSELTIFVFKLIFVEQQGEASELPFEQTKRIRTVDLNDTTSELSSFAQIFCPPLTCPR